MKRKLPTERVTGRIALGCSLALGAGLVTAQTPKKKPVAAPQKSGAAIFAARCAPCHGASGEGSESYRKELGGTRTAAELAKYVEASMPPSGKKCTAPEATQVAGFLYEKFYSPLARERRKPPRAALSRLTVRQWRSAVADLLGGENGAPGVPAERGINGEYYRDRYRSNASRAFQRVDSKIQFDFGTKAPADDGFLPHFFSMRWSGSVIAPETGEYEFIVRSDHAVQLWVNDTESSLIDARTRSANVTEFKGRIFLLGGRAYPLRLEFSKGTNGVDDTESAKKKPPAPARIALFWKRPHLVEEPLTARNLSPTFVAPTFVATTPFPPDDRSMGYERGSAVSRAWDEATINGALETADFVVKHLRQLSGVPDNAPDRVAKLQEYCTKLVERALRAPLTPEQKTLYIARSFEKSPDPEAAVRRVMLLALQSPRFLFREPDGASPAAYRTASRLAFALWDSLPDRGLLAEAAAGRLNTREQILAHARRMASDPRALAKQREFFLQWLRVDQYPDLAKDAKKYPDFTPSVAADLRASLELSLDKTLASEKSDWRELLTGDKVFLNGPLARLYGVDLAPDAPFTEVALDPDSRAGVLTHPYLLASFAYLGASSPIHRGVLLVRNVFGRVLQPPPVAVAPLAADLHPGMTTRERVSLQTKPETCQSCHATINALGFTLERFDAIGRLREFENKKKIDCSGSYIAQTGETAKFDGAKDLAKFVTESDEAHRAFVEKFFQYHTKQPIRAWGEGELPKLTKSFVESGYNIRSLAVELATDAALSR